MIYSCCRPLILSLFPCTTCGAGTVCDHNLSALQEGVAIHEILPRSDIQCDDGEGPRRTLGPRLDGVQEWFHALQDDHIRDGDHGTRARRGLEACPRAREYRRQAGPLGEVASLVAAIILMYTMSSSWSKEHHPTSSDGHLLS